MFEKLLKWLRGLLNQMFDDAVGSPDIVISSKMENTLPLWVAIYECGGPWCSAEKNIHSLCLGPAIAQEFSRIVRDIPEVTECYNISGSFDYLLKIHAPDMKYYQKFVLNVLGTIEHLASLESVFVMDEVKHAYGIRV